MRDLLQSNSFIRVRTDHPSHKAGKDGTIIKDYGQHGVLMMFYGIDRRGRIQKIGRDLGVPQIWQPWELDLASLKARPGN